MSQLIIKIWVLLAVSGVIGALAGWLIRALGVRERERHLREEVEAAEAKSRGHRDEAARLAAKLQVESNAASGREVSRLESDLRAAQAQADREAAAADDLRGRLSALERQIADMGAAAEAVAISQGGGSQDADNARMRMEIVRLKANLAAAEDNAQADLDMAKLREALEDARAEAETLRGQTEELELLRERLDAAEDAAQGTSRGGQAEEALRALAEGDEDRYAFNAPGSAPPWLQARVRWLEQELAEARSGAANPAPGEPATQPEPDHDDQAAETIKALGEEIAELKTALETAQSKMRTEAGDTAQAAGEVSRLTWRNRYLTSRVRYLEERAKVDPAERVGGEGVEDVDSTADGAPPDAAAMAEAQDLAARLGARVADLERRNEELAALQNAKPQDEEGDAQSTEWRNRYLTSRVEYLERRLAEQPQAASGEEDNLRAEIERLNARLAGAQSQADEAARLRMRVAELEAGAVAARPTEEYGDRALEWRNRYLTSRVKYLEERLATSTGPAEAPPTEAEPSGDANEGPRT